MSISATFHWIVSLEEQFTFLKSIWKLLFICFWKSNGLETHDECYHAKDEDWKNVGVYLEISNEGSEHGAEPGHGTGEGEGRRPDHGGEELVGVGVDDAPAHLGHVLASHGQHHDGPLVAEHADGDSRRGHAEQSTQDVVTSQVGSPAKPGNKK